MPKDTSLRHQLEFEIEPAQKPDRNRAHGGRSFYFFDFDDNVMVLGTEIFLFHQERDEARGVSTAEFARIQKTLGQPGPWLDFALNLDDSVGSFRRFRDHDHLEEQPFVADMRRALAGPPGRWHGPSWSLFQYAVHNGRPVSIITARGHAPRTIAEGVRLLSEAGHLSREPNYLSIFPVTHPPTRDSLDGDGREHTVAELKHRAIVQSVEAAMAQYGANPHHRFGMSDDDPHNVALAVHAMQELKQRFPENSFFVIDTHCSPGIKREVLLDDVEAHPVSNEEQLALFG